MYSTESESVFVQRNQTVLDVVCNNRKREHLPTNIIYLNQNQGKLQNY